ncbi:MAG: hypothetical protein ABI131_06585 [Nostocoides sp.]
MLALAAGVTIAAGSSAGAAPLPSDGLPVPLPSLPALPVPLPPPPPLPTPLQTLIGTLTGPLAGTPAPAPTGTGSAGSAAGLPGLPSLPGGVPTGLPTQVSGPLSGVGTQFKGALNQAHSAGTGTPLGAAIPDGSPGSVLNLAVNLNPLATACLQVTGSGTAIANTTITVGGQDITAPLVQALPGVLAPCPAGTVPDVNGLDGTIGGLVGLCVRANQAPPLKATILALDTDVLAQLTKAGLPLQQVVVPCPKGTPGTTPVGTGGGTHTGGGSGNLGSSTGSHNGTGASTGAPISGNGNGNNAQCAAASDGSGSPLDLQTMGQVLPHSPVSTLPWLLLGLVALGRKRIAQFSRKLTPVRA